MVCESCGEKKKKTCDNNFPKAVVEINNPEQLVLLRKVVIPASMGTEDQVPAAIGKYCNVILQYEANGHVYLYSSDGIPTAIEANVPQEVLDKIAELSSDLANETRDRELADNGLQTQIDAIVASSDVKDIVGTYAELEAYDTSTLGNNDIIKVLADETHDGATTYYRWSTTSQSFSYIGEEGPYYTKAQTDVLLGDKQNTLTAGSNITIENNEISATDTTYSDFTGATSQDDGSAGLVPAPLAGDETKFLSGNGQWTTVSQYALPIASANDLGGIKVGNNLTINPVTGVLDANGTTYTAGANINISDQNVISATDTTYTAGTGLDLTGTEFSVDTTTIQPKLTAGNNITIDANNEISATDTTYAAGNAIDITGNVISADVYPADFFTAGDTVNSEGSNITINGTTSATIKSVELKGDTEQQTYRGVNLINIADGSASNDGLTITFSNGVGTITGTRSGTPSIDFSVNMTIPAGTYSFSSNIESGNYPYCSLRKSDNTTIVATDGSHTSQTVTLSESTQVSYIRFYFGGNFSTTIVAPQLELGSEPTSFEPYVGGTTSPNPSYPQSVQTVTVTQTVIATGKNLFDGVVESGEFNSSGNINPNQSRVYSVNYIRVKPNTQYVSNLSINRVCYYDADKTFLNRSSSYNFTTFTTPANAYYVRFDIASTSDTAHQQIEQGSTSTSFQQYQSQTYTVNLGSIELCKIGTYQDYIYKSSGDWYVHKETGRVLLTGSENWVLMSTTTKRTAYYTIISDISPYTNSNDTPEMLSNYFTPVSENGTWDQGLMSREKNNPTRAIFCMNPSSFTTTTDFTTWLSSNNASLYYVLATPIDTQITDASLIAQLDALANGRSYLDVTNFLVTATGTNLPAILDVDVNKKSLAGVVDSIPEVNDATLTITQNGVSAGTFTANSDTATTIALTDTTYSAFTGTDGQTAGSAGLVPAPATTDAGKFLKADGTWATAGGGGGGSTITMTNVDPGEGSPLAADNYVAVYGQDPIILDYSTNEINTGTKWIDGSVIYKKTLNTGALPNSTYKRVAHNISNLYRVIKIEGYAYSSSNSRCQTLPLVSSTGSGQVSVTVDTTEIEMVSDSDRSAYTESYITLYYTKSA